MLFDRLWTMLGCTSAVFLMTEAACYLTVHGSCRYTHPRRTTKVFSFQTKYLERIGIDPVSFDMYPSSDNLSRLTEAHLGSIPFSNLRLHGGANAPASLDVENLASLIIDRRRGGLCYELNGLFFELLKVLGYNVCLVPAQMINVPEPGQTFDHLALLVSTPDAPHPWFVDVGMGEPPLHPLLYDYEIEQKTPDGMQSRFVRDKQDTTSILEWFVPGSRSWQPRLTFQHDPRNTLLQTQDFDSSLHNAMDMGSPFRRKLVVSKQTRDDKTTLAGDTLIITRNRFSARPVIETQQLGSVHEIRQVLFETFGIPPSETTGLEFVKNVDMFS